MAPQMGRGALAAAFAVTGMVLGTGVATADPSYSGDVHRYLYLVRGDYDAAPLWGYSDAWLLQEGNGSCSLLRQGYSHSSVMAGIRTDAGLPFSTNADVTLLAAATTALCPDQSLRH